MYKVEVSVAYFDQFSASVLFNIQLANHNVIKLNNYEYVPGMFSWLASHTLARLIGMATIIISI